MAYYPHLTEFEAAWARCENTPAEPAPGERREPKEHALLAAELGRYLRANGFRQSSETR